MKELEKLIRELETRRDEEAGGAMKQLESDLNERQKEDAKAQSNVSHKKEALKAENKKMRDLNKNCTNVRCFVVVIHVTSFLHNCC